MYCDRGLRLEGALLLLLLLLLLMLVLLWFLLRWDGVSQSLPRYIGDIDGPPPPSGARGGEARQGDPRPYLSVAADLALYRIDTVLGGSTGIWSLADFLPFWMPIMGSRTGSGDSCGFDMSRPIFMPVALSDWLPTASKKGCIELMESVQHSSKTFMERERLLPPIPVPMSG